MIHNFQVGPAPFQIYFFRVIMPATVRPTKRSLKFKTGRRLSPSESISFFLQLTYLLYTQKLKYIEFKYVL